jgi:hypothetical protein
MNMQEYEPFIRMRVEERLREGERARLAAMVMQGKRRAPLYAPVLAWMGRLMLALGKRLVKRYGDGMAYTDARLQQMRVSR